jgi:branched-chain amino acid transport system substrate-binding protein
VVIASVGTQSGILGTFLAKIPKGVQVWVQSINARGGVNCHPVRHIIVDDNGDPSRHQALVRQLVEENRVLAIVPMNTVGTGEASAAYLQQKQVPVIGGSSGDGSGIFSKSPVHFPQIPQDDGQIYAGVATFVDVSKTLGHKKLGLLSCQEAAICDVVDAKSPAFAAERGMEMVYRGRGSFTQPDFTSQCLAAQSAGVETFALGMDSNSIHRVVRSCSAVNYQPTFASWQMLTSMDMDDNASLDGMIIGANVIPWFTSDNAAVREYQDALRRYAPDFSPEPQSMIGWAAAKLFEAATQQLPEPPTSAAVLDGLYTVKGNDLGGITYPLTFTKGQNAPLVYCWWQVQIKDGTFMSPNRSQRSCK